MTYLRSADDPELAKRRYVNANRDLVEHPTGPPSSSSSSSSSTTAATIFIIVILL
jgi:hypothetical protein